MTDIALYSIGDDQVVRFSFANTVNLVSGPQAALQLVAAHLFTTAGSVAFSPDEGGSAQSLVNSPITGRSELITNASIIVSRALESIRSTQSLDKESNETVSNLKLIDARVEGDEFQLDILIQLADGNSFSTTFGV